MSAEIINKIVVGAVMAGVFVFAIRLLLRIGRANTVELRRLNQMQKGHNRRLRQIIDEAEADIAAGRSRTFTVDELEEFVKAVR